MLAADEYEYLFHEIKNDVCVVDGSLQLIAKQHPEVHTFRYWDNVITDITHLLGMCKGITTSRLRSSIQKELIYPSELFSEIQNDASGLLNEEITCLFLIDKTLPPIRIDPIQIRHALINLIKNSAEAIVPANNGQITISATSDVNLMHIQVQDNGHGIPNENMEKIFLPSYSGKPNGAGLGLAITKEIIEAHGGTIDCKSDCNVGTTFTILLPIE